MRYRAREGASDIYRQRDWPLAKKRRRFCVTGLKTKFLRIVPKDQPAPVEPVMRWLPAIDDRTTGGEMLKDNISNLRASRWVAQ